MWPFTKEKTIASAYTGICTSCNDLHRTVRWHDCTSYPISVKVYDVDHFYGFWCSNCDKKWGLNQKDFKKTLDNMHFLIKREFVDETARTLWAKEISTAMT